MKTHKFHHGRYRIDRAKLDGVCDIPGEPSATMQMIIPPGKTFAAFHAALHEALHADDCPISYVHRGGVDGTKNLARFLWRLIKEK